MSDLGSKTALQADIDAKVTTNGNNENTGARVNQCLENIVDTTYANFQESSGNVASASTVDLGAQKSKLTITGTTTITSFGTADVGVARMVIAGGVFQITHHNTDLIIPGGVNITTALEDVFVAISHGSGSWQITQYTRRSGAPLVGDATKADKFTTAETHITADTAYNAAHRLVTLTATGGANVTYTLAASPTANTDLTFFNDFGSTRELVVDGNGKNMQHVGGEAATVNLPAGTCMHIHYSNTIGAWLITGLQGFVL